MQGREEVVVTWLEMRSSHTDRAICMALGLWVTEVALSCIFQEPCRLLAWFTASRNICSCLRVLSTAPMLTILGSQAARAKEQEKSRANVSRCMVLMSPGHSGPDSGLRERDDLAMYGPPGPRAPARSSARGFFRSPGRARRVLSEVLKRFGRCSNTRAEGAEKTAAWTVRLVRTLRRLQQLRSRERDLRVLPLPPPPLPDAESSARLLTRACVGVNAWSGRVRRAHVGMCTRVSIQRNRDNHPCGPRPAIAEPVSYHHVHLHS